MAPPFSACSPRLPLCFFVTQYRALLAAAAGDDYDAVLKTFLRVSNISGSGRFGPNRCLKYLIACVVQNSDMVVIELGSIDTDLGRNKLCLGNRAIVITAIQS
jgi:hypothetical protein